MARPIIKHYVTFLSPGTMFSEQSRRLIAKWDAKTACKMAKAVKERHGATPYGFSFQTILTAAPVVAGGESLDVTEKEKAHSGTHFITGEIRTYDQLCVLNDPKEEILRSNMRCNGWWVIVQNRNSYLTTMPFDKNDLIVNWDGKVVKRGDDADLVAYRKQKAKDKKEYAIHG